MLFRETETSGSSDTAALYNSLWPCAMIKMIFPTFSIGIKLGFHLWISINKPFEFHHDIENGFKSLEALV